MMPDVAMATASLGHLQLNEQAESLQLDLGDGSSHIMTNVSMGMSGSGGGIQVFHTSIRRTIALVTVSIYWEIELTPRFPYTW